MKKRVKLFVNNAMWDITLDKLMAPPLLRLLQTDERLRVLEIGCGRGGSTKAIVKSLPNVELTAIDVDPQQVLSAHNYLWDREVDLRVGDHADLKFEDEAFDLVIEFNTLHHVQDWRKGLAEVGRVLKRGGTFAIAGVTGVALSVPGFGKLVAAPSHFTSKDLISTAEEVGLLHEQECGNRYFLRHVFKKS